MRKLLLARSLSLSRDTECGKSVKVYLLSLVMIKLYPSSLKIRNLRSKIPPKFGERDEITTEVMLSIEKSPMIIYSVCILLSVLLHFLIFAAIDLSTINITGTKTEKFDVIPVFISPAPETKQEEIIQNKEKAEKEPESSKQIVSESSSNLINDNNKAHFLSNNDNFVIKEQIKRGEMPHLNQLNKALPLSKNKSSIEHTQTTSYQYKRISLSKNDRTEKSSPSTKELAEGLSTKKTEKIESTRGKPPEHLKFFLNNKDLIQANGDLFSKLNPSTDTKETGLAGSQDYLPNIPDGEITLLNTKANRYANFVKRVAEKVFGELRSRHWKVLSKNSITHIVNSATIVATLDLNGKLIRAELRKSSGDLQFDQVLHDAVSEGTWDINPPKGSDDGKGNIVFMFESKIFSQISSTPNRESRYLFLGTGLM